ncbi:MAG: hypothetical protein LV480_08165 [Methylacidiphilales bacterium]|nr:hypothetical protein [Candidatus Methylacidiphilales bacterium]
MPKSNDVYPATGVVKSIDDSIGTHNNLADYGNIELRDNASQLGKLCQTLRVKNKKLPEGDRPLG